MRRPAGALIDNVEKGSAAEQAGLASGDVLLAVNGRPVDGPGDLLLAIDGQPVTTVAQANNAAGRSDRPLALLVQRGERKVYVPLRLV
jgi:serine protease Do